MSGNTSSFTGPDNFHQWISSFIIHDDLCRFHHGFHFQCSGLQVFSFSMISNKRTKYTCSGMVTLGNITTKLSGACLLFFPVMWLERYPSVLTPRFFRSSVNGLMRMPIKGEMVFFFIPFASSLGGLTAVASSSSSGGCQSHLQNLSGSLPPASFQFSNDLIIYRIGQPGVPLFFPARSSASSCAINSVYVFFETGAGIHILLIEHPGQLHKSGA